MHIILVSIDTLRADCINASPRARDYLQQHATKISLKTEALDKILNSGLYYNNCFSAAPYTSASHAAYFTGQWPLHNGIYEFFNRRLIQPTIFEWAKKQGYTTIFQTDFPVILGRSLGFTNGIDHYFIEDEAKAFKTLISNKANNTLSFFHFGGVHYPYGFHILKFGGQDYINKVSSLEKKYRISNREWRKPNDILTETFRNKQDTELLLHYKYIIEKLYREHLYNDLFSLYLEGINYFMAHRFDRFINVVKNFVDNNQALLFIFSDHGEEWDADSEAHHNSISDNVLRVPLIVYGRQIAPRIEENLVRTIDLAPTIKALLPYQDKNQKLDGSKLDIFTSGKNRPVAKFAVSQCWLSIATKKQIADHQKMAMKTKKTVKPLKTYLFKEAARDQLNKIAIFYHQNGTILREESSGKVAGLKKILIDYNASKVTNKNKLSRLELKIRNELTNLGYKV
ncbi:MAG: sulfatase-like hydrolase/transferase [Candidatus Beckwithbacteria bacterium]|nr:sulfatase-like hydrolase/transferase [Candidatus Beckwithbacteria bacterium]